MLCRLPPFTPGLAGHLQCRACNNQGPTTPPTNSSANNVSSRAQPRREFVLSSFASLAVISVPGAPHLEAPDGRTVVNSLLGAYGLPQFAKSKGFRDFDDFNEEYTFRYPTSWVRRNNALRSGVYISDFNTADKLSVEVFPESETGGAPGSDEFTQAVIGQLLNPGNEVGGNSRIEPPRASKIKMELRQVDGYTLVYLAYPSSTTTRSGYDVRRKNVAVAGVKKGTVYALGASARSDQWNPEKAEALTVIIDSFRLR